MHDTLIESDITQYPIFIINISIGWDFYHLNTAHKTQRANY